MFYLGIDQHRKQLTVNLRNEQGDVVSKRQVSTQWDRVRKFFEELRELAQPEGGFVAVVEVCGFNNWLLKMLDEYDCRETVLIQPDKRSKKKTDRRDAATLSQTLWVNRERLLAGMPCHGFRRVAPPSKKDGENRELTTLRKRMGTIFTRTINKVHRILLKHNLQQECPTKGIQTKKARRWLAVGRDRSAGDGPLAGPMETVGIAIGAAQQEDSRASTHQPAGRNRGEHAGGRGLQQPDVGLADRLDRPIPTPGQPG